MTSTLVKKQSAAFVQPRPEVRPGYTVRVHERIQEGNKERIQVFEGLVIAVHKGQSPTDHTITVRRLASGVGVEKIFPMHSPKIEKIDVKKVAKVRRSKLFFLRGRRGKAARLSERFTTANEFAVAAAVPESAEEPQESEEQEELQEPAENPAPDASEEKEEVTEEAPAEETSPKEVKEEAPSADEAASGEEEKKEEATEEEEKKSE